MGTAPSIAWTKLIGGVSGDTAYSVSTASDGSNYIAGFTGGSLDGQTNSGYNDAFITKFNSDGSKVWTKLLGGRGSDYANSVSTASDGSIYIAGFTGNNLDGQTNNGSVDAFITKFNGDGSKVWTKLLGGGGNDYAESVSTASDGSIYIAGRTEGSIDGQTNNGSVNAFITKFNSDGSKVWTKLLGGASYDYAKSVSTASDGSIYIAGFTDGSLDGQSINEYNDAFITKFNSDGSKVWAKLLGGGGGNNAYSVSTASDGSIYIAGFTGGNIDGQTNSGYNDAFITKFNSDGSKVWTKLLGGGGNDYAESVSTASDGSIYIAGYTGGSLDGQSNNGSHDAFITKFNSDGSKVWTKQFGGALNDIAISVSTASDGSIYIAGFTDGSIDGQSNNGNRDAFITKFNNDGSSGNTKNYTLTPSAASINEGSTLTTSVATTNVESGTTLYYSLSGSGITATDFSAGSLTGAGTVASRGSFSFSHTLANDLETEGTETLNIKLFSDSSRSTQVGSTASVAIADTSLGLTYYNPNTANTLTSWNIYRVDNSVKAGDIVNQWFGTATPTIQLTQDIIDTKLMDVVASTWSDKVKINRVVKTSDTGGKIEAKQIDFTAGEVAGSVISGGKGNDDIKGFAGWDIIDGGAGDDLIHGGNGRDILTGGTGRDELHGDFGWNTYRSEKDGASDLIAVKSDHYLVNWLYGIAGNSPNGEKSDIIEGLDPVDKIRIIGVDTSEITFAADVATKGVTGIGIYGKGILEALYTGGDLTVAQITQMTSGDASAAAMSNSVNSYGVW